MRVRTDTRTRSQWLMAALIVAFLAVLAWGPSAALGASTTLVPNADGSGFGSNINMVGCSSYFQCVDESIPEAVNDSDYLEIPSGLVASRQVGDFAFTDIPANSLVTDITMTVRLQRQNTSSTCNVNSMTLEGNGYQIFAKGLEPYPTAGTIGAVTASASGVAYGSNMINNMVGRINLDRCNGGWVRVYAIDVDITYQPWASSILVPDTEMVFDINDWRTNGVSGRLCLSPNTWQCPNDVIIDTYETDTFFYNQNSGTADYGFTTASTGIVGRVNFRGLVRSNSGTRSTTFSLLKSDNSVVYSNTAGLTTTWTPIESGAFNTYLTQTEINGLKARTTAPDGWRREISALNVEVWPATITGVVGTTSACDGVTPVVGVAVNNTKVDVVPCQPSTGNYAAVPTFAAGDIVTVYMDGVSGVKGSRTIRTLNPSSTVITGADIWQDEVHVDSLSSTPISAADINQFDGDNDSDIEVRYPVGGRLESTAYFGISVNTGTFRPGVDVRTENFWVTTGGTYDAQATRLELMSSWTGTCSSGSSLRNFCITGTFLPGTGTVSYQGTGNYFVSNATYANLEVVSGSSNTVQLGSTAGGTINATSLVINGTGGAPLVSTSTRSPTVNISGATTVTGTATLGGSGTGTMTIGGDLTGTGQINFTGGSVHLSNAATNTTLNAGGTLPGTAWQFATLRTQNTGFPQRTVTVPSTSREIRVSVLLSAELYADLNASASTQPITVTGNVNIAFGSSITPPSLLEVQGNFTNGGTFYNNGGTVRFSGAPTSNIAFGIGSFANVDIPTPGKVVQLQTGVTVQSAFTTSGTCASPVVIRSDVGGSGRTISRGSTTGSVSFASIKDITVSGSATVANSSGDLGNNSGITFSGTGCSAPSTIYTDPTNASAGAANRQTLDARGAFHSSSVNTTATTADRYRAEVLSSPLNTTVRALFPLDGTGADRSSVGATATATGGAGYTTGATNFGQAGNFDGIDDQMSAPTNAAYNTSTFTVDLWFKTSGGTSNFPTMVSRSGSGQAQFQLGMNRANKEVVATLTTPNGMFEAATPWAPWIDNQWHHIAMTADGSKVVRLYIDGVQYDTVTYTGTLHLPNAPIYIGGSQGFGTNAFGGQIDDVQFANAAYTAADIAGYAATRRPHAQTIWQSTGFGTNTGAALSGSCAASARCSDIVYSGSSLQVEGARYYIGHQYRTTAGIWSDPTYDWFETSDGITVSAPASVSLGTVAGSSTGTASFNATTTCTNSTGCKLLLSTPSNAVAMSNAAGTSTIPPNAVGAPVTWSTGGAAALGFTVLGSTTGKDTTAWGTGTDFSNLGLLKFTGGGMGGVTLKQSSASGSETTNIGVRLDTGAATPASYTGTIYLIAVDAP